MFAFQNLKMLHQAEEGGDLGSLEAATAPAPDPLDLQQLMPSQTMHVTDEEGNPIQLTMQDGRQLEITTADGQSLLVTTEDGRTIPVQFTTTDGHPLNAGYLNGLPGEADVQAPCVSDSLIVVSGERPFARFKPKDILWRVVAYCI